VGAAVTVAADDVIADCVIADCVIAGTCGASSARSGGRLADDTGLT
jgi:hypothetical protein